MNRKRTSTLYIRELPRDLKDHFKAHCTLRGITMTDKIIELMKETISKESKLEVQRTVTNTRNSV